MKKEEMMKAGKKNNYETRKQAEIRNIPTLPNQ